MENRDFGWALNELRAGCKMCRVDWNGANMYVELQLADPDSKMSLPYLYIKTADDDLVPWVPSQTDLLSYDWRTYFE